jgi:hypothetical protein
MFNESNVPKPEYRVRTVTRHVVTRYCYEYTDSVTGDHRPGSSSVVCEVASEIGGYDIAQALAKAEGGTVQQD